MKIQLPILLLVKKLKKQCVQCLSLPMSRCTYKSSHFRPHPEFYFPFNVENLISAIVAGYIPNDEIKFYRIGKPMKNKVCPLKIIASDPSLK